jgi:hypothetical protein
MDVLATDRENNILHLTLMVRLCDNHSTDALSQVSALQDLIQVSDPCVRRVSEEELHFSLANFYSRELRGSSFEDVRKKEIEPQVWFNEFKKYCADEYLPEVGKMQPRFTIKRLYKDEKAGNYGNGSIGINLVAADSTWREVLKDISDDAAKKLEELGVNDNEAKEKDKVKMYSDPVKDDQYPHAVINLFRIFTGASRYSLKEIAAQLWKIEESLERSPVDFVLTEPVLVISDQYLFNPDPVILTG